MGPTDWWMNALVKEIRFKPWKWKSTFLNLIELTEELKENATLLEQAKAENDRLTQENTKLKTDLQNVLNTIRVTQHLDRKAPTLLLHR